MPCKIMRFPRDLAGSYSLNGIAPGKLKTLHIGLQVICQKVLWSFWKSLISSLFLTLFLYYYMLYSLITNLTFLSVHIVSHAMWDPGNHAFVFEFGWPINCTIMYMCISLLRKCAFQEMRATLFISLAVAICILWVPPEILYELPSDIYSCLSTQKIPTCSFCDIMQRVILVFV